MKITVEQLVAIAPHSASHAAAYVDPINDMLVKSEINTPQRLACFIGQVMHETGSLQFREELASGEAYEGRLDLGNTQPGDGKKFKGRALLDITGRHNYIMCSEFLFGDHRLVDHPELLLQPTYAAAAAGWFWLYHGCNDLADADDQRALCRRINGGMNGFGERVSLTDKGKEVLGVVA